MLLVMIMVMVVVILKQYIHKRNQVIESDYSSISLANGIPDEGIIIPLSLLKFEQQDQNKMKICGH